jgi:hypothetical protein
MSHSPAPLALLASALDACIAFEQRAWFVYWLRALPQIGHLDGGMLMAW